MPYNPAPPATSSGINPIANQDVCAACEQAIRYGVGRLNNVPGLIKKIISEELWRERKVETGEIVRLNSFRELITAKPYAGWSTDPAKIEAIIRDDPEVLAMWREAMKEQGRRSDFHDNVMKVEPQGNSRAYTVSRLKRERPDLFAQVKAKRLSANAAAIKAGWRKKKTPLEQVIYWWGKASEAERKAFWKKGIQHADPAPIQKRAGTSSPIRQAPSFTSYRGVAMNSTGWFKALRNPEALELIAKHSPSFVLLFIIAYRANRHGGFNRHNLRPGQAFVGDYKKIGLTRQEYRTALEILQNAGFITIQPTNRGTVATLMNARLFDINVSESNTQSNHQLTISQPTANQQLTTNEEEKKRRSKEEGEDAPQGKVFQKPTIEEVRLLAAKIGLPDIEIEKFWNHYQSNGWRVGRNPMRSLSATLSNWKLRYEERRSYTGRTPAPNPRNAGMSPAPNLGQVHAEAFKRKTSKG